MHSRFGLKGLQRNKNVMDNTTFTQKLSVPKQTLTTLSFTEGDEKGVARWIENLPKANIGETARQLYQGLIELNQLKLAPDKRLLLLELIRPEVYFVCTSLSRYYLGQSIVLEDRPRKVANLSQALQNHLAAGYKIVAAQESHIKPRDRAAVLAMAIQRAIRALTGPIVRAYQLYCPVAENVWLEIHQLYQLAHIYKLQDLPIRDSECANGRTLSIQQAYVALLLLGAARPNQMRQSAMTQIINQLEDWVSLAKLIKADSPHALFIINPDMDCAPRYRSMLQDQATAGNFGLDTRDLVDTLTQYLLETKTPATGKPRVPEGMGIDLLQHLSHSWGDLAERTFARIPGRGELRVTIGMTATHYQLAGKSFAKFVDIDEVKPFSVESQRPRKEGWSLAFDGDQSGDWPRNDVEQIDYTQPNSIDSSDDEQSEHYQVHNLKIVNHSPNGFCLTWPREVPKQLQAGELLGIQEEIDHSWSLAVVRWIRQIRGGGTQMGIELFAPHCSPCAIKLLRNTEEPSRYLRALMIPEVTALEQMPTVITPRLPFQLNSKVMLLLGSQELRAQLVKRVTTTGSYSQFQYQIRSQPEVVTEQNEKDATKLSIHLDDDFDSLWKSL